MKFNKTCYFYKIHNDTKETKKQHLILELRKLIGQVILFVENRLL